MVGLVWRHINSHLNALNAGDTFDFVSVYIISTPCNDECMHDSFANRSNFSCIKQQLRSACHCTFIFECLQKRYNNNEACVVVSLCLFLFVLLCLKFKRKINEINVYVQVHQRIQQSELKLGLCNLLVHRTQYTECLFIYVQFLH